MPAHTLNRRTLGMDRRRVRRRIWRGRNGSTKENEKEGEEGRERGKGEE